MRAPRTLACPSCGYRNEADAPACSLCHSRLEPATPAPTPPADVPAPDRFAPPPAPPPPPPDRRGLIPRPVFHLAVGIPLAIVLNWGICGAFGWGVGALPHELGHTIAYYLFGYLALPSAVFTHQLSSQKMPVCLAIWAALGYGAWRFRKTTPVLATFAALAVAYPIVAFNERTHHLAILAAGQAGEMGFAAFFFWRALRGGLYRPHERPVYAMLAWSAWFNNVNFFRKLVFSDAFREVYRIATFTGNEGDNDFSRIADELGLGIESVARLGLLPALVVPPLGILLWWLTSRETLWDEPGVSLRAIRDRIAGRQETSG